ncbi:universal stress protein [Streptomyces abyssomicinicus]|uniref:universal stress protein n=1 Tax=Streptomyces abyssomicinicus TaxID=574929 RepID=UPI00124F9D25|nr:universal stress protein [Streptomyces abyssomicinicus]
MSRTGVPVAARVVVGVSGSPGSLTALRRAAEEAGRRGAELWPVLAWEPPGAEAAALRSPAATLTLTDEWELLARERLVRALRDVFGGAGLALPGQALIARGSPGRTLLRIACREADLLVVGAGRRGRLRRALWPSVSRHCLARAACPVLAVPPSPLESELAAVRRRNAWGLRLDTGQVRRELDDLAPGT